MEDTLTLREIAPPKPAAVAVAASTAVDLRSVDLKDVALAQFGAWRKETADTKAELDKLALDLSTQARIDEAVSLRHRKINVPLALARKVSKAMKSKLTDVSKSVGAELEAIEAAWADAETAITPQIEAAQKKIDDAKEAIRLAEEARLQGLRTQVDDIMSRWVERCAVEGITAERIGLGIQMLQSVVMPSELADVLVYWDASKDVSVAKMRGLHGAALAREEAARLEAQRIENERVAAEQAERQRVLDAQAAEIKRQADELAAQRAESERLEKLASENRARLAEQERRSQEAIDAAKAMATALQAPTAAAALADDDLGEPTDTTGEPRDQTDAEIEAANGPEVDLPPEPATLTLGAICEWLGFTVNSSFLASIGVEHAERRKMAYLYRESQRAEIKGALMDHLAGL